MISFYIFMFALPTGIILLAFYLAIKDARKDG
jgi:hypothetical protein